MQCGSPSTMVSMAFLRGRFNDHTEAVECIILKEQLTLVVPQHILAAFVFHSLLAVFQQ